ncbi:MAG: hypothetical protein PHT95_07350 [Candidatus Omnitrophica bacterium]|nr:hypothetical protein [Candidatus Omnitrophota bacterium]MDD4012613.1 hypothetical protein [Candidatus Omnitrophota bacterium]
MKRSFVVVLVAVAAFGHVAWASVGEEAVSTDAPMVASENTTDTIGTDAPTLDYDSDSGD